MGASGSSLLRPRSDQRTQQLLIALAAASGLAAAAPLGGWLALGLALAGLAVFGVARIQWSDVCLGVVAAACLRHTLYPVSRDLAGGILAAVLVGCILFWLVGGVAAVWRDPWKGHGLGVSLLALFLMGWSVLSFLAAPVHTSPSLRAAMAIPPVLLWVHWVLPTALCSREHLERPLRWLVALGGALSVLALILYLHPLPLGAALMTGRFVLGPGVAAMTSLFHNPNVLGGVLVLCLLPSIYFWDRVPMGKARRLYGLLLFLMVFVTLMTGNRSAYLGLLVIALAVVWRRSRRGFLLACIALALALIGLGAIARSELLLRLGLPGRVAQAKLARGMGMALLSQRQHVWAYALKYIRRYPVLGVGPNNAMWAHTRNMLEPAYGRTHAHNTFLAMAEEMGLPAGAWLVIYLGALAFALWRVRRLRPQRRELANLGLLVLAVCFPRQMFEIMGPVGSLAPNDLLFMFFVGWGFSVALGPEAENAYPAPPRKPRFDALGGGSVAPGPTSRQRKSTSRA